MLRSTMAIRADRGGVVRGLARAASVPAAAFVVHQLRYLLAYGGSAGVALQRQGHSYLHSLVPWVVLLLALAIGVFLSGLGRALVKQTSVPRYSFSLLGLWIICSACLVAIYASQESLEALLATGHPGGLAGVLGYGGWWAIPAALCVGFVLAALLHGARWAIAKVASRHRGGRARSGSLPGPLWPLDVSLSRTGPLALGWCGRGPPS
jgi:hypothetical protein